MKKSILILGNGESVLKYEFGSAIDDFPTVGRINNYTTIGFEKYIGSKTDIWFNGANQTLKKRPHKPGRIVVLIPPAVLVHKGDAIHPRIMKRLEVESTQYELVPLADMERFARKSGVARPTTGLAAILWALEHYDEVTIHGFDFFISSKGHYNDSPLTRWLIRRGILKKAKKHDLSGEKIFVEALLKSGELYLLGSP
ncbi:MAG: hypothetical protein GXO91_02815 [FCB group bacterium]|nr:hypothetical protein [FCB group bacterium]